MSIPFKVNFFLKYKNIIFLLIAVFQSLSYSSQNREELVKIDTLLNRADHSMQIDFAHSLQLSKQSLIKAEKVDDSEKRARSYLYIARSLVFLRRFDECSSYLEKGLQERSVQQNVVLKASFLAVQARYYSRMSLSEQAYQNNLEVLDLLRLRTDLDSKLIMCNMYIDIADYYTELKDYKKAHVYADQSIAASEKIPMKEYLSAKRIYREKAFIYFYKSWIYLKEKKSALAYPFIQKGYNQAVLEKYKYLAPFYEAYGDYYFQVHNYKYAIDFYLKSMENKKQFMQNSAYVDSKIAESFKLLDDREKEIYYLQKAEAQHKLDMNDDKRIVQKELDRILEKKQIEKSDLMKSNTLIFLAIIFIFIILLIGISMRHQKIRNKKKEIIGEQNVMLSEKELEIEAREEKIEKLQKKVTESFSELSDLVKGNSSQFWGRFQEVYPDFCTKILEINPMLKASELTFCAYIYMGLSTKEVAEYTFKAPKTIENKRYNLRKRLGLSPEEDFVVWIRKYIDGIR